MASIKAYTPTATPRKLEETHAETVIMMQRLHDNAAQVDAAMTKRLAELHDKTRADFVKSRRKTRTTTPPATPTS
jgi:hypothetical protein